MKRIQGAVAATVFAALGLQGLPAHAVTSGKPFGPGVNLISSVDPLMSDEGAPSASLGGQLLFAASDPRGGGNELWATNGADARLVKDINLGIEASSPSNFVRLGSRVLFAASSASGRELWTTDGTTAGTRQLLDIAPQSGSSNPGPGVVVGNQMYFAATTPETGRELWVTDGTSVGTRLVRELGAAENGIGPYQLTAFGSKVVFAGFIAGVSKVFVSDGTVGGTGRLDTTPANVPVSAGDFTVLGNRILFSAETVGAGNELWSSGGALGDAQLLKDVWPGPSGSGPRSLTRLGGTVLFAATDPNLGRELWTTDGTAGGTVQVRDLRAGGPSGSPTSLVRVGSQVLFAAQDAEQNLELWTTRGTALTTRKVTEVRPGPQGSDPYPVAVAAGKLIFGADAGSGVEPWVTDGTAAGTRSLGDVQPGAPGSSPSGFGVVGGTALFDVETAGGVGRLAAYTVPVTRLKASPKRSYSRSSAARKKIRITVAAAASGVVPTGTVALYKGSKRMGSATLVRGTAKVRITAKLKPGKHRLTIRYGGSVWAQGAPSVSFKVRVR